MRHGRLHRRHGAVNGTPVTLTFSETAQASLTIDTPVKGFHGQESIAVTDSARWSNRDVNGRMQCHQPLQRPERSIASG